MVTINIRPLRSFYICRGEQYSNQTLQSSRVLLIKSLKVWTIQVQQTDQVRIFQQRYHDLRVRSAVAGNMARELVHVRHDYRFAFCRARAAHTLTNLYTHARRLALERSQYQIAVFGKIESGPIHIRQRMKQQGREVRCVRDQIALTGEQGGELRRELVVELVFRCSLICHF